MRHRKAGLKLSRKTGHLNSMFRNLVTSLFKHDRIRTTDTKAKELRRWADHLVTLAKRGDLHARRQALAILQEREVVQKLFENAAARYGAVAGGYTRLAKIGPRAGDAAPMSLVELIGIQEDQKKKKKKKKAGPKAEAPAAARPTGDAGTPPAAEPPAAPAKPE
jgi:large subunit ribosomal protein L17